ncbi:MAG: hypothetical protein JNL11_10520 [Bdellovibrionaceae bacterium]|nr:hypothetical protein [Pseudobdellovibrionaceae bacterium]
MKILALFTLFLSLCICIKIQAQTLAQFSARTLAHAQGKNQNQLYAHDFACKNEASECAAYCALSDTLHCDSDNYLTQFGYKYCHHFLDNAHRFSKKGQVILSKIRSCLIAALKNHDQVSCSTVESFAMESHYSCYIHSGFCDLPVNDALGVAWLIRAQFFNKKMHPYFLRVQHACTNQRSQHH